MRESGAATTNTEFGKGVFQRGARSVAHATSCTQRSVRSIPLRSACMHAPRVLIGTLSGRLPSISLNAPKHVAPHRRHVCTLACVDVYSVRCHAPIFDKHRRWPRHQIKRTTARCSGLGVRPSLGNHCAKKMVRDGVVVGDWMHMKRHNTPNAVELPHRSKHLHVGVIGSAKASTGKQYAKLSNRATR